MAKSIKTERLVPTSGPTAPVPKDPQPSVDRVDELARRILSGDILLPKFQRSFVWERDQIRALLDSVARGYPIGSVLLWQSRQELSSEKRIGDLAIKLPKPDYPVNYLLDGQQRLSTICGALFWAGGEANSRWNIAYDLKTREFIHLSCIDDPPLHQVRVNKLSDPIAYFKHLAALDTLQTSDKKNLQNNAEQLFNRFKDYKIATVTLGDMSIADVAPIFERINSTGTSLTIVDLMRAATWSPDFDLIESIEAVLSELLEKGFSAVDKKVVLRGISAAAGGGFSTDSIDRLREYKPDKLKDAVAATSAAYKRMVDFLSTHIKIPGAEVIPYSNQLAVLGEIFRRISTPSSAQFNAIEQWFWRTAASGYFGGWNTGMMGADLKAIINFVNGQEDQIKVDLTEPRQEIWAQRQFRSNNAHSKVLAIVLSYQKPIDILTGQNIDTKAALAWQNVKEYHHFFPQDYLKKKGFSSGKINALANIVMISSTSNKKISARSPADYLCDVEAAAGDQLYNWLDTNLISPEAFIAAKKENYEEFLSERAKTIHAHIKRLAGWKK
ncbi:MAG: DUF262 domain-containing protein [Chlorobiales bacterium]|nr:DUF262 domain-containing protein [Chlorobiales bacterium]